MTTDGILALIGSKAEGEDVYLPLKHLRDACPTYLELGVFKPSPERRREIYCPNGCGEQTLVMQSPEGGYFVCCSHGDHELEDIPVSRDEIELWRLDWVAFRELTASGAIEYHRPSTPGERKADPAKAKEFLQDVARRIKEKTDFKKPSQIRDYILSGARKGMAFFPEIDELRELKRIHKWQTNSFNTYVKSAFAGKSDTRSVRRKTAVERKRKLVRRELEKR